LHGIGKTDFFSLALPLTALFLHGRYDRSALNYWFGKRRELEKTAGMGAGQ